MQKNKRHLQYILVAIENLQMHIGKNSKETCLNNLTVMRAIERELETICQAVKDLGEEVNKIDSSLPWKRIVGMRDILVHHYMEIDAETVWDTVINRIPELQTAIQKYLQTL